MNFLGVLYGDEEVANKITAAKELKRPIDGHCPGLTGRDLNAYVLAGITTEHEATSVAEAKEKLSRGMMVWIREGSAAKNLENLLPLINEDNWPCFAFCADDINCHDLDTAEISSPSSKKGWRWVSTRSEAFTCHDQSRPPLLPEDRGAIAPGRKADFLIVDNLQDFTVLAVYKNGQESKTTAYPSYRQEDVLETVHLFPLQDLAFPDAQGKTRARVIRAIPDSLYTAEEIYPLAEIENRRDIQKSWSSPATAKTRTILGVS